MIKINGIKLYSTSVIPVLDSENPYDILEDNQVAIDNTRIKPLILNFKIFVNGELGNYVSIRKKLEEIFYSRNPVLIEDLTQGVNYENFVIKLKNWVFFKNGFEVDVTANQIIITKKATDKKTELRSFNAITYTEKPLKDVSVSENLIPELTKTKLNAMGIDSKNGIFNLKCLDFIGDNIKNGFEGILTTIGNNKFKFAALADGGFKILDKTGSILSTGQKLLENTELLANMIPGVDYSMRVLKLTNKVTDKVFEISNLGKDYQMVVNRIGESGASLIEQLSKEK